MKGQSETLRKVLGVLMFPLKNHEFAEIEATQPRSADPLWHIGHTAFDASRALVLPFGNGWAPADSFKEEFHGLNSTRPWSKERPEFSEIAKWWEEVLVNADHTMSTLPLDEPLPAKIAFTAYSVSTLREAYDYVIYHSSFHIGVARGMLGLG